MSDNADTVSRMTLEEGIPEGVVTDIDWTEADAFNLGLTEPEGGEVVISVKLGERHYGVTATAETARTIADALNELADTIEKGNPK